MTTKNIESKIPLRGDLKIIRRDAQSGEILKVSDAPNVITFSAVSDIIGLLCPNIALGVNVQLYSQLRSLRLGTSNVTPQRTDLNLGAEAVVAGIPIRIQFDDAARIIGAAGTVELVATLGAGQGNGVTYREASLWTQGTDPNPQVTTGAIMFSRQVFSDQVKTGAVTLEFRWRLSLTV